MKKGVILLLTILSSLELVNAQTEITLFGQSYSIILLAPIFFMGLISLFFIGLILKDNIKKLKLPKISLGKILKHETPIQKISKQEYREKFVLLRENVHRLGHQQAFNEFNEIVKEFFKDKFNIKHEFAFAELGNMVKGHAKDVELANKISTLKYSGSGINLKELRPLFNNFESLLGDYKLPEIKIEPRFFQRIKINFLALFKKKEVKEIKILKPNFEELKIKTPAPIEIIQEIKKPAINIKKFSLFNNILARIQKYKILKLIERGKNALTVNPLIAKRYYARALLGYYKMSLKEEKDILDNLTQLHNQILNIRKGEKTFLDLSKNLIDMKHKGKHVSKESLGLLSTLKNFIEREELLAAVKLKEFSSKLKHEERKLGHYVTKEGNVVGDKFKYDIEKFGSVTTPSGEKMTKPEISQKTINLVDQYKPNFDFLYKQPRFKAEKIKEIKPKLEPIRGSKKIRILQKQRNELYNKLLDLESGKLSHHKLN
ncbi:MAG: hypothetical protein AABW45_02770 [Nanoarchaeota archaeon]